MDKQNFVYVDANYLKELEETAKKVDYYKGIIDGIMMCKDEPQTYVINPQEPTNDDECFECDDFFTCGGQCNKIEDEPQTDCPWK